MAKFKVGDVCIVIKCITYPELAGTQVTITSGPQEACDIRGNVWIGYDTDYFTSTGRMLCPREENLRLKKFPGEEQAMKLFTEVTRRDVVPA